MSDLIQFLTSKEIMIVYILSGLACIICLIVYIVEKNNEHFRRKQNTKELNKLVEKIKEKAPEKVPTEKIEESPIIFQEIKAEEQPKEVKSVDEMLESSQQIQEVIKPVTIEKIPEQKEEPKAQEEIEILEEPEELEYTSIEPDQETAKLELKKLAEELEKQEELERQNQNIELTNYEEEQEATAIISMDELIKKSKELYEANELTQYKDEGNEPISLQDLEEKMQKNQPSYEEPFIIGNVVSTTNDDVKIEVIDQRVKDILEDKQIMKEKEEIESVIPQEIKEETKHEAYREEKKFKSSPIISPIFGIEKEANEDVNLMLENTANYEKLDQQIQRSNDFIMSLKELKNNSE